MTSDTEPESPTVRLNRLLVAADMASLQAAEYKAVDTYISLILRWNERVNLTAIREEDGILARHFFESIVCARALPRGIATLLDFGSGAGFPGIPIALCRPEIAVTLAESQGKKAAFLQEVLRVLELSASVHSGRAETLQATFDCVTLRAVDRMAVAVQAASRLVRSGGWLALMTTGATLENLQTAAGKDFDWHNPVSLPRGNDRILALGLRISSPA